MTKRVHATKSPIVPAGIDPGTWEYMCESTIAARYDSTLAESELAAADSQIVHQLFRGLPKATAEITAVDFGCGTGRSVKPLAEMGCRVLAVDLSLPMLQVLTNKLRSSTSRGRFNALTVQANLLDLAGIRTGVAEFGLCLFSTYGMLRGKKNRARFLHNVRRIVRAGGVFVVHAHSIGWQLNFPGGLPWLVNNWMRSRWDKLIEFGDRFSDHAGVKNLPIHSFSLKDFQNELIAAGFQIEDIHHHRGAGKRNMLCRLLRISDVGWTITCRN